MQDMLVPIFGENGAIIFQYVITLAVILGLIGLTLWAIRRYSRGAVGPSARGRLPRLAVVDTLAIDGKRRLVLVRRDNVEHLVLIGGPTDVVVEPSIVRQRVAQRPGQPTPGGRTTQIPTAAPQPPPPPPAAPAQSAGQAAPRVLPTRTPFAESAPVEKALPFPPRRSPLRPAAVTLPRREPTRTAVAASALAASEPLAEPATTKRTAAAAVTDWEKEALIPHEELGRFAAPARSGRGEPRDEPVPGYPSVMDDDQDAASGFVPSPAADFRPLAAPEPADETNGAENSFDAASAPPTAATDHPEAAATPAEVSELENEMARLLDEISTSRRE